MNIPNLKFPTVNLGRQPTTREKIFFIVVLAVSLFIFMDNLWQPKTKNIKILKTEFNNYELQIDAIQKLIEATVTNMTKGEELPKKGLQSDPYVKRVLERRVVDITEEINSTADLMGGRKVARKVQVLKVEIGNRTREKNYTAVPITVELKGRYTAIREYLGSLENIGRPVIVKSFSVKKIEGKSGMLGAEIKTELLIP